jgi:hypothetical protein
VPKILYPLLTYFVIVRVIDRDGTEWIYIGLESVVGDEVVYIQEERGPSAVR